MTKTDWDIYYKGLRKDPKTRRLLDKAGKEIDKKMAITKLDEIEEKFYNKTFYGRYLDSQSVNSFYRQEIQSLLKEFTGEIDRMKYDVPCVFKNCAGINLVELDRLLKAWGG